jgi:2-polyprenyl-6-methoxyphenol hydroxylase-like FAD-dependent oxidoreductase
MFGRKSTTEALVVGAGPVGLFAALQLARQGVEVEIIDSQWRTAARSYALALHSSTLELFASAGFADTLLDESRKVESVGFYDQQGLQVTVDLSRLSEQFPFALVLPQSRLEERLEELLALEDIKVNWNHRLAGVELNGGTVRATIQRLGKESTGYSVSSTEWVVEKVVTTEARFIFGADGHNSTVRRLAGIDFEDLGGSEQFAVFECSSDRDAGGEMQVVLDGQCTSVYWPLPGDRFRWSFGLGEAGLSTERAKHRLAVQIGEQTLPYLSPESLAGFLTDRAPWFDARVDEVHWSVGVRFERRLAAEFGRGPVSLLGDAAHVAGPIGVQSMNLGLAEAAELASRVAEMVRNGASRSAIDAYDRQRVAQWRQLLGIDSSPAAGDAASEWIRQRAGRIPGCIPASGEELAKVLAELDLQMTTLRT